MKNIFSFILLLFSFSSYSQNRINPHPDADYSKEKGEQLLRTLSLDSSYDVGFYHLDLEIAIDSPYVSGNVYYEITSLTNNLTSLKLDLDSSFTVDSISQSLSLLSFNNNILTIDLGSSYQAGDAFSFKIYYHGIPPLVGGIKGLVYQTSSNNPIIASLSTPFLAHSWWPCKDGPSDKADSVYVDITIKDTSFSATPVIAVSNGLLDTVETISGKKTFKWQHAYPIVPYYIMVAISNYELYTQTYTDSVTSFPIEYYTFPNNLATTQQGVIQVPNMIRFFSDIFGPYPFAKEKYGMTELGFYSGIENQTNSIVVNMGPNLQLLTVHELAHQWFADMITCETWNHAWLNEGFANYAEALWEEKLKGFPAYTARIQDYEYFNPGSIYLQNITDPFGVFQSVIYNKGAYVLHMLRGVLGDADFFAAIKAYSTNTNFRYQHAITEDFQQICEQVSGLNLTNFFDQWIYDEFYPEYQYDFVYDLASGNLEITVLQSQQVYNWRQVFDMPVQIGIEFVDGTDTLVTVQNDHVLEHYFYTFSKEVVDISIDPNNWILKRAIRSLGIGLDESNAQNSLRIYPNPSTGLLTIKWEENSNAPIELSIMDINGKLQHHKLYSTSSENSIQLQLSDLSKGLYFVDLKMEDKHYFQKIILTD